MRRWMLGRGVIGVLPDLLFLCMNFEFQRHSVGYIFVLHVGL